MDSDREILIRLDSKVSALHSELVGDAGREGRIPRVEARLEQASDAIQFWRGVIWVIAGLVSLLGGTFIVHLFSGR